MDRRTFLKTASATAALPFMAGQFSGKAIAYEGNDYEIEQAIEIPSPTATANWLNHGYRPLFKQANDGRITCMQSDGPIDYKYWFAVGSMAWGEWRKSRTLFIRNFDDLNESRDVTFPDDELHNGICDTLYDYQSQCLFCLHYDPNTISWVRLSDMQTGTLAHVPYSSNGKMGLHKGNIYLITDTVGESHLYRFPISLDGPVEPIAHATLEPEQCHSIVFWRDWCYVSSSVGPELTIVAVNAETCEPNRDANGNIDKVVIPNQHVGTHEMVTVQTCDSDATLMVGTEGVNQLPEQGQALIAISLSDYSYTEIFPYGDTTFRQPVWGVRFDGRYIWVTYGCGTYVAYDPISYDTMKFIQLPTELAYPNGGAILRGNQLAGTRFAFGQNGQPSTMFRLRFD